MLSTLTRNWWVFIVRGIAAITFGIAAFVWPASALTALVWLFGAYLLVDGIAAIVSLATGDPVARRNGWAVLLSGALSIILGVAAFVWTDTFALSLLYIAAFWAIVTGTLQVIGAIYLRREIDGEIWLVLSGIASVIFGIVLIAFPSGGLLSLVWLVAFWSIVEGIFNFGLAFRLRELKSDMTEAAAS